MIKMLIRNCFQTNFSNIQNYFKDFRNSLKAIGLTSTFTSFLKLPLAGLGLASNFLLIQIISNVISFCNLSS